MPDWPDLFNHTWALSRVISAIPSIESGMSESVVGTIPTLMTRGWKGDLRAHLIFTNERLIVTVKGLLSQIAMSGGAFGAVGGAVGAAVAARGESKRGEQVNQMTPEQILQSEKRNFAVPYSNITRMELGKKMGTSRLYVVTPEETYKFKFQGIKSEQLEEWFRSIVPPKVPLKSVDNPSD